MNGEATIADDPRIRDSHLRISPAIEFGLLALAIAVAVATYFIVRGGQAPQPLLTPPLVASLLIANLACCGSLIVLFGRRIAKRRAARSEAGGRAQLHVRLVAIFSILASVPTVLLAVTASVLFQYGAEFWSTGRVRDVIDNSKTLAEASYEELISYVDRENVAMANDVHKMIFELKWTVGSPDFHNTYAQDVLGRSLSNSLIFSVDADGKIVFRDRVLNSDSFEDKILPEDIKKIVAGLPVRGTNSKRTYSLTPIVGTDMLLYSTREGGAAELAQRLTLANRTFADYNSLRARSRAIQLQFNAALLAISLLIIAIAVWIALVVADRLVRPVNQLVGAARRVADGDLTARVPNPRTDDEVGTLANAFNTMTGRLEAQTSALERRRALIEAVMSGVSAGVISVAGDGAIRLINAPAAELLRIDAAEAVGASMTTVAPELADALASAARESIVELTAGGEKRTLAVRITADNDGSVLTFDDITQQLLDQRRAAWSDVARRIAHEIKNPLTPIQLAAERLQRRYGKTIEAGDTIFGQLTDTIVRQVGDLRRMVDEFSSFARMPKPVFHDESLIDLARQSLFLHEVAHPAIRFSLDAPDAVPLVCDRRQIGQALTNIVKNAVEAIEARGEGLAGEVIVTLKPGDRQTLVEIADDGIGLPLERDRIVEPYMTTRARGTGLGLAIVKKIIEEHCGTIAFADRPGGGTVVSIVFDTAALDALLDESRDSADTSQGEAALAMLTRTGPKS
ncbi:ATP-binding protein [Sphingomonas bacterium]|uniref:sensor histidine kinase NtrY-like n=1 Tax=Sphingomonas bacterium TaxID=1895847 RepID=UPI0026175491|nr:ATP-binding protein [Sphingomonas bacterium]MDB5679249.1 sensor histidine kinase [Sphingomonas bacterium]MDB5711056.1 sensor histidine kinase [Sphingomonas bacterium]